MSRASGRCCFVIGWAGFLGAHLCERLLDLNDEVICFDNFYIDTIAVELHHPTGLMPAERRLPADFARGGILQQANSRFDIRISVIRAYLHRNSSKTDTEHKRQFLGLFLASPVPLQI